ncbi:MAG: type IV pilin protein [Cellvibrionales bacterium]|nr:type IV pilin protein [Cellvibrionales bacterium]
MQYTERVQRVKAQEALEGMAMAMERVRLEQNDYRLFNGAATPTDISTSTRPNANFYPDQSPMSGAARYNLTVEEATRGFFVLRATPINGQLMDGDGYFELHSTGRRGWDQDGGGVGANEWCWSDRKGAC